MQGRYITLMKDVLIMEYEGTQWNLSTIKSTNKVIMGIVTILGYYVPNCGRRGTDILIPINEKDILNNQ